MLAKVVSRMQEEILTRNPDQTSKEGHSGGQSTLEWVLCVCYRENCECWNGIIRQDGGGVNASIEKSRFLPFQSVQMLSSAFLLASPIKNSLVPTVLNPTLRPSANPTYPLTPALKCIKSTRGIRSQASSPSRCRISIEIAEPVTPRNCVSALVSMERQVRMSGGQDTLVTSGL
jgi:hypothetical protein